MAVEWRTGTAANLRRETERRRKVFSMGLGIRGRIFLICTVLAIVPLAAAGVVLAAMARSADEPLPMSAVWTVLLVTAVASAGTAVLLGAITARRIVRPIQDLTEAASAIGDGDLAPRTLPPTNDEIGMLTGTFNHMARQWRVRIGDLHRRSAEQTKALATFREISRLSAMLEEKQLAAEVVERAQKALRLHHAHIYFYDAAGENLILTGATGEDGRRMLAEGYRIPRGKGPAGRAAESNAPVLLGDVSQDPDRPADPPLPKTRSEAAVPIAAGERVLGVLDVQQNIIDGITPADIEALQSIAEQVALAVRKTRGQTPHRRQAEREALIASVNQKIRETTSVEDALRVAASELGRALGEGEARIVVSAAPPESRAETEADSTRQGESSDPQ
jgi:putative methionine-R-sulfoxide reductase with GAF domain